MTVFFLELWTGLAAFYDIIYNSLYIYNRKSVGNVACRCIIRVYSDCDIHQCDTPLHTEELSIVFMFSLYNINKTR